LGKSRVGTKEFVQNVVRRKKLQEEIACGWFIRGENEGWGIGEGDQKSCGSEDTGEGGGGYRPQKPTLLRNCLAVEDKNY